MTLGALEIKKVRKHLGIPHEGGKPLPLASKRKVAPLSGKVLAGRLKGLLSKKAIDDLERHINESCELVDD